MKSNGDYFETGILMTFATNQGIKINITHLSIDAKYCIL